MLWKRADLSFRIIRQPQCQICDWLRVALYCDSQSVLEVLGQRGRVSCRRHKGSYRTQGRGEEGEGERTSYSLCDQGVGADIKFSDGWKNCHSQQSLFLWDLRMKRQSNTEEVSLTAFCTHTLLAAKLRIWSCGSGKLGPECIQSSSQLRLWHIWSDVDVKWHNRSCRKSPAEGWRFSTCESLRIRSSGFLSLKTAWRK